MRKTIDYCDIHGTPEALSIRIDNNGVESETEWFNFDLGHKAAIEVLAFLIKTSLQTKQKEELCSYLKSRQKKL